MIQADHPLAVTRRCALLDVARSTVYYRPTGISAEDLALMRRLDEIHLARIIHEEADYSRKTNAPVWYKGCAHRPFATTEALA